ncbi:MAG: TPM domain-containing protein [Rhizobiaceae bacterium]|nr:TPM domain-containing protein [Rhizobiaceae bacterium]
MKARTITPQERARVASAISTAEARTSGEIYCVLARSSSSYFYAAAFIVFVALFIVSMGAALWLEANWYTMRLPVFVAAQIAATVCILLLLAIFPSLRLLLVPRKFQFLRAHDNAVKQFLARNVHVTAVRTGVLIFVSLAERYAEVVADSGISAKVGQEEWDGVIHQLINHARRDEVADGFVVAIEMVGALLAKHFPPKAVNPNELDDHLVEI